ncbi:hypothetical protein NPIL_206801 [Nephila pilipes]|uniref:Uncharacterized protein n=1 Tax=Nephila pilipes TaxID=299642 RepID=A0A8X6QYW4_NEPPI|nr:hypothetical protein NPIL_206801 [Nephila pilipes]
MIFDDHSGKKGNQEKNECPYARIFFQDIPVYLEIMLGIFEMEKRKNRGKIRKYVLRTKATNVGSDHERHKRQLLRCESGSIPLPLPTKEIDMPVSITEKSSNMAISQRHHVASAPGSLKHSPEPDVTE